jgi:hypothetical protein
VIYSNKRRDSSDSKTTIIKIIKELIGIFVVCVERYLFKKIALKPGKSLTYFS